MGLVLLAASTPAMADESVPTYEGPVEGGVRGYAWNAWPWTLPEDYREDEYFQSGIAEAYGVHLSAAVYRIRIQVYRPIDPEDFDGTVFVEWNNVTGQIEINPDWWWAHPQIFRDGSVAVLASVQETGTCGTSIPDIVQDDNGHPVQFGICNPAGLKGWDPVRYGSLDHPGDDYMWDIFSQVLDGIGASAGADPYGGLEVERVIAMGDSQSAQLLDWWLCNDAARNVDGVLIHSDWGWRLRGCDEHVVPTLRLETEESAHIADATAGPNLRIWQVPGAPHGDYWEIQVAAAMMAHNEMGAGGGDHAAFVDRAGNYGEAGMLAPGSCLPEGNMFPTRYAVDAALAALVSWVSGGPPPATLPQMDFTDVGQVHPTPNGQFTTGASYNKDGDGNTGGGMRSPVLDHPVATYHGAGDPCGLLGWSRPLSNTRLAELYSSHADYVTKIHGAAEQAIRDGRLMPADAEDLLFRACRSTIGGSDSVECPAVTATSPHEGGSAADTPVPAAGQPDGSPLAETGNEPGTTILGFAMLLSAFVWRRARII